MQRFQVYACIAVGFAVVWAVLVTTISEARPGRIDEDFSCIPMKIGNWQGENMPGDYLAKSILTTTSILSRHYTDAEGNAVDLSIVYGRDLSDFHQPEVCMTGAGWKQKSSRQVVLHPDGLPSHKATLLTLDNDYQDGVMIYWYYMGGEMAASMAARKAIVTLKAACGIKPDPSVMVKFTVMGNTDIGVARRSAEELDKLLSKSIIDMANKTPKYKPSREL
jgi:EpsI family protein